MMEALVSSRNAGGKMECDLRAFVEGALDLSFTAMQRCHAFDDRQPETRAASVLGASWINTVETIKNARKMFRRDAAAVILNRH
jgi:hypothetical protein